MSALANIERYYRFHARVYDATRWSFLFGRSAIIQKHLTQHNPSHILEVGCGTGKNLVTLCQYFPTADLVGIDISADMLKQARRNLGLERGQIQLLHQPYDHPLKSEKPFDLVICSYSLSMINPGWEQTIQAAAQDLKLGGLIAVVDFHDSRFGFFKRWMAINHVRMEGHLLPKLQALFRPVNIDIYQAYGGLWQYLFFVGGKINSHQAP